MPFVFTYILKFSISLAVVFLFYQLVLRKLTFYNWNRFYLLGYTLISFFIPFIDISGALNQSKMGENNFVNWMPAFQINAIDVRSESNFQLTLWNIIFLLIIAGILFMAIRLIIQLISFRRMVKNATIISNNGLSLYQIDENIIPFSFGNAVFINKDLHSEQELQEIIRHEIVHVRQRHSVDIIWSELLCLVNWFNPFAWLIRKAIRQNLEFIADNKVLNNGVDRKHYQYLLLKVIGNNHFSIAPKFNFSSLKKRIAMMNKLKSAKINLLRFLFVLPLLAVILLSFRKEIGDTLKHAQRYETNIASFTKDTLPLSKKTTDKGYNIEVWKNKEKDNPMIIIKDENKKEVERLTIDEWNNRKDYYENLYGELPPPPPPVAPPVPPTPPAAVNLPENVQRINVNNDVATVWLKNGEKEKYDMTISSQKTEFEKKYGKLPPPPPPVPAVPVMAPIATGSNGLSKIADEYEITDKKAVLRLKNGKTEEYDLTNKKERSAFEEKYGKIVQVNTNVNMNVAPVMAITPNVSVGTNINSAVNVDAFTAVAAPASGKGSRVYSGNPFAVVADNGTTVIAPMNGSGVAVVDDYGYTITGKEDILITITKNTSRTELDAFVNKMKEKGITLRYDEIRYNDKGLLVSISGTMRSNDGHSNFVATDFNKLILAMIKNGDKTYFKVSVKDNKEVI